MRFFNYLVRELINFFARKSRVYNDLRLDKIILKKSLVISEAVRDSLTCQRAMGEVAALRPSQA